MCNVFAQSVASVVDTTMGSEFTDNVQSIIIQQVSSSNSRRNLQTSSYSASMSVLSVAYFINFYSTSSSAAGSFASSVDTNLVESVNNGVFTSTMNSIASGQNVTTMTYAFSDTVNTSLDASTVGPTVMYKKASGSTTSNQDMACTVELTEPSSKKADTLMESMWVNNDTAHCFRLPLSLSRHMRINSQIGVFFSVLFIYQLVI